MSTSRRSFTPSLSVAIDSPNRSLKYEYRIHTVLVQVGIVVLAWKHQRMMKILNAWHLQQETRRTQRILVSNALARLLYRSISATFGAWRKRAKGRMELITNICRIIHTKQHQACHTRHSQKHLCITRCLLLHTILQLSKQSLRYHLSTFQ